MATGVSVLVRCRPLRFMLFPRPTIYPTYYVGSERIQAERTGLKSNQISSFHSENGWYPTLLDYSSTDSVSAIPRQILVTSMPIDDFFTMLPLKARNIAGTR